MHIHKVKGIEIKSNMYACAGFMVHSAMFYSSSAEASFGVTFYTGPGRRLTVNGVSQWGECPSLSHEIAREDIHTEDQIRTDVIQSGTGNYVQNVYVNGSLKLSYVTPVPVLLALVDDNGGGE